MKPARILLLGVAIVAGGLAAFLATRGDAPQVTEVAVVEETSVQVLVANQDIGVGQRLNPALVEWQNWPETALRPEYVTDLNMPDAVEQLVGTVARFEIFAGEPLRESKLVRADQGYLSAVLARGMRGVSLPVDAASSAGGFIVPNDRVDVVHTIDNGDGTRSSTILQNVKVLAIGLRLGEVQATDENSDDDEESQSDVFQEETIATLELSPIQAETVIGAEQSGRLSLVLRSVTDFSEKVTGGRGGQTVRMIRFGNETEVQPSVMPISSTNVPAVDNLNAPVKQKPVFLRELPKPEPLVVEAE